MRLTRLIATIALAGTAAAAHAGAVLGVGNLLVNSDFETSNVGTNSYRYIDFAATPAVSATGWTFTGASGIANRASAWGGQANSSAVAFLQSYVGMDTGVLSQTFVGQYNALTISFSAAQSPSNSESLRVLLDGVDLTPSLLTPQGAAWTTYTLNASNLNARSHTISFIGVNSRNDSDSSLYLDNISVMAGTSSNLEVPEPGSLALVGAALAGLGFVRRRLSGHAG